MSSKKSPTTLTAVIKRQIGARIILTFVCAAIFAMAVSVYELSSSLTKMWSQIDDEMRSLENFVISQVLIDNEPAIAEKIDSINHSSSQFQVVWDKAADRNAGKEIRYEWPFNWKGRYVLRKVGVQSFGQFVVRGSLIDHREVLREFVFATLVTLFFALLLIVLLYPLTNKIPRKIFLDPLSNILNLLREKPSQNSSDQLHHILEIREVQEKITSLISDVKKASEQAAKGELAVQVAHDLRFPVDDFLQTIDELKGRIPKDEQMRLEKVALRIGNICNGLLARHRQSESGLNDFCFISEVIQTFVEEQNKKESPVRYEANISPTIARSEVCISETDLNRILSNLSDNSRKALGEATSPIIRVNLAPGKESQVVLTFSDNGIGMDAATLEIVRTRGGSHRPGGTGIGLKSVKEILRRSSGQLNIESTLGVGTTVKLEIFTAAKSTVRLIPNKGILHSQKQLDFVLVDDDSGVHERWHDQADQLGLDGVYFASADERLSANIEKTVPHYIDVNLVEEAAGIRLAEILHRQGFQEIYLITGDRTLWGQKFPFAKEIRSKVFPYKATKDTRHIEEGSSGRRYGF